MDTRLVELDIPLPVPFSTAEGSVETRRAVLVGLTEDGVTGWGEAAPYPGVTPDTVEGVWVCLTGETVALTPSAAAAVAEAEADLEARLQGRPLWAALGGSRRPLLGSLVVGLGEDAIGRVRDTGAIAVKLKIHPGDDVRRVELVRQVYPDLTIGVDANGSYSWEERGALLALDRIDVAYVEQPFADDDLESHAGLRQELLADVVIDEPIDSVEAAVRVLEADAADALAVKPSRIGLEACRIIHDLALAVGLRVAASGLLETAVGRAHTLAVATLPGTVHCDLADDAWFFPLATGVPKTDVVDGWITASDGHGIGVEPDLDALAPYIVQDERV
jgi:O-succinylbenzoate synthase